MSGRPDPPLLTGETLNTNFAEAYRSLRANIGFSSIEQPVKSILVTSAAPGEGKSTTLLNLGIIMAQAGPRVFVVDADFRHPTLHSLIGFRPNGRRVPPGLSDLIAGNAVLADVLLSTAFPRLSVVPAGIVPANPGELLGSRRMRAVIQDLASQADYVLLDSPPCLDYADAFVLSSMVDGVLYVVRAGTQDRAAQRRVQRQLQQAKARMLGVVFNGAEGERSPGSAGYYGRNRHNSEEDDSTS
jgi:capsular exopolysaccharide synthesis family protein